MTINRQRQVLAAVSACLAFASAGTPARAVELLVNGNFEAPSAPPGWLLTQSITDLPGAAVTATEFIGFANHPESIPGENGLFLRPFAGNQGTYMDQNHMINAVLTQSVAGVAGETYTFTGHSWFADGYSGIVDELDEFSPSGAVPSPTESTFEMAFLNASNAVIGSPLVLDLRTEQFADSTWREHSLMGEAPDGTVSVQVTAAARDMVENFGAQNAYFDNFSLRTASEPAVERLISGDLNAAPTVPGWTLIEEPAGSDTASVIGFAHRPTDELMTGNGIWLRAFEDGDAILTQTVPGSAGGEYTFSGWSRWEQNYSGGVDGTTTETTVELAFLDSSNEVIGTPLVLDVMTEQMNDNMWRQHSLSGVAPEGTVNVRVTASAIGMFFFADPEQSAFWDDFSLDVAVDCIAGDFSCNGAVENADLTLLLNNWGAAVPPTPEGWLGTPPTAPAIDNDELTLLLNNWGNTAGAGSALGATTAVPEPAAWILAMVALTAAAGAGSRRRATT